ncbi:hypothetical protein B5F07_02570 [Lachnoclostridium sp. An169]|mgnify:CR=1 FL=1|uniref:polysaccharide pyruvyl transferase family protein n=1 Tax=Lachnoclostridium sp. An169 TaxID=1965569 RepID=UPI000B3903C0|nr:polysaccharide pyruvyl transferase family protein [Lachnoclostridium sp. An169]OUP86194.1 hypothetical protein B5F07_02570 [Lachnoclostridium sp. An169]
MNRTVSVLEKRRCTGCASCFNKCPVNAITMQYDREGFIYPVIAEKKCVNCGQCFNVCPELNTASTQKLIHSEGTCYATMADDEIRAVSSSGGMFTLLAEKILDDGGVVAGAAYSDDYMEVSHIIVDGKDGLKKLRGSKYVQSAIGSVYKDLLQELKQGRKVLFVGCPCQVAGLYSFLGQDWANLYTADLVCHGANSLTAYQSFVKETAKGRKVKEVNFRDKTVYGWSTPTTIYFEDGTVFNAAWNESKWNDGFLKGIINRPCCSTCHYAQRNRVADLTLGDFWQIHRWNEECNDWKGTSLVLVNTAKGEQIFNNVSGRMKLCQKAPLDFAVQYNGQLVRPNRAHPGRKFFFHHLEKDGYHKSLWYGQKWHYDVGLVGWWFAANYGSVLTYYALGKILDDMDMLALMIRIPKLDGGTKWEPVTEENIKFMEKYFPVSKERSIEQLDECNRFCDAFMLGSDQLWVQNYVNLVGYTFFLDFAADDKKKIAYATSLGYEKYQGSEEEKCIASTYLKRFNAISVRETSGTVICQESFGVNAVRMLDPVFLCNISHYDELAQNSTLDTNEKYILCYILDPSDEKRKAVEYVEKKLGMKAKVVLDMKTYDHSKARWGMDNVVDRPSIEDFIKLIKNSSFLVSDSHHGICFGLIYHINFICIANRSRGYTRFESLFNLLRIRKHMVDNAAEIIENDSLFEKIDYEMVDQILEHERDRSLTWLKEALNSDRSPEMNTQDQLLVNYMNHSRKLEWENKRLKNELQKLKK